jgi:hypothetical protein
MQENRKSTPIQTKGKKAIALHQQQDAHPRERVKPTRPPKAQHTLIIATSAATPDCLQGCRRDGGAAGKHMGKKGKRE